MAFHYSPKIPNANLIIALDAANPKSYPGSGDNWYNTGTGGSYLVKGTYLPQHTTLGGATCFNFNQIGAYFRNDNIFSSQFPNDQTNLTIISWIYPAASELSTGDRGNIVKATNNNAFYMSWNKSNRKQSNYWYSKTNEGYHESGAAMTRETWNNVVAVWDSSSLSQFLNGTKTTASTSGTGANRSLGLQIGWEGNSRQFAGGIALIYMYDKALSDAEVQQTYNNMKSRFGR